MTSCRTAAPSDFACAVFARTSSTPTRDRYAGTSRRRVISDGAPSRFGGPQ
jgi:hypothetical protein